MVENLQTIEQQIVTEYGKVIGWVKNNAVMSLSIGMPTSFMLGKWYEGITTWLSHLL